MMSKKEKDEFENLTKDREEQVKLATQFRERGDLMEKALTGEIANRAHLSQKIVNLTTERTTLFQALRVEQQLRKRYQWAVDGRRDPVTA